MLHSILAMLASLRFLGARLSRRTRAGPEKNAWVAGGPMSTSASEPRLHDLISEALEATCSSCCADAFRLRGE